MKTISISQLQKNISLLSQGEELEITSHGFVLGRFTPQEVPIRKISGFGTGKIKSNVTEENKSVKIYDRDSSHTHAVPSHPATSLKDHGVQHAKKFLPVGSQCKHNLIWHEGCHF